MKAPRILAISLAALTTLSVSASAAETAAEQLEGLSQAQLQEAFRVLSQHYIEHETLDYEELNRAALDGLLRRLSFGAELVTRNGAPGEETYDFRFHEEIVTEGVAYLRPVSFDEKEVSRAATSLRGYAKADIDTLVLDLRAPVKQVEFGRAASFADLFTEPNELLFKIKKPGGSKARPFLSKKPRQWNKRLIILIDRDTSSVAETVAAVLRQHSDKCLVIGERTLGKAVQYEEIALNETTALRFASAQVLLPDDTTLFRKGVTPDLRSVSPPQKKNRIFAASHEKGMAPFVFDRDRPRMNEAALVAGVNPELDYYLARSLGQTTPFDRPPIQDRTLQTAIESLIAIDYLVLPAELKKNVQEKNADEKSDDEETPADGTNKKAPSPPKEKGKALDPAPAKKG